MITTFRALIVAVVLASAALVSACGGGEGAATPSVEPTGSTAAPTGASTSTTGVAVSTPLPSSGTFPQHTPWTSDPKGLLVFDDFRNVKQDIFKKVLPDGEEINLTNNPADDFDPDVSDDGSKVVFASNRTGTTSIWSMDIDGGNLREVTTDGEGGQAPRWSRDGKMIAYARNGDVAVINADGTGLRTVMLSQPEVTADPCRAGAFVGGWSPDDSRITYYSASVTRSIGQVCTVAADGSDVQTVVADPDSYDVEPVYSPDGTQIVYRTIIDGQHDIWIVDLATGARQNLTHDADLDIEPDWSPDGQWIVFGSLRSGQPNFDLYIMRPDGSDVRRITSDPAKEANPVWAP